MKIGVCIGTSLAKVSVSKAAGYDFIETSVGSVASLSQADFDAFYEETVKCGIPCEAANCFVPGHIKLVGDARDDKQVAEYLTGVFPRLKKLGIKTVVFGSSGARRIPEGMSLEQGRAEIVEFLKNDVAPLAEKYDILIAIEPLRPTECNAINTVAEGLEIAKAVDSPYIKLLADVAHMYAQNESLESLYDYEGWLIHAHTSNPAPDESLDHKRIFPAPEDTFKQESFIEPLKAIGTARCSIEAGEIDFTVDAPRAFDVLKPLV